jgi:hypothetical protein
MLDGSEPRPGSGNFDTTKDLNLIIEGNMVFKENVLVTRIPGGNVYRLSGSAIGTGVVGSNNGIVRYNTQAAKSFRVCGYQMELGKFPSSYIVTGVATYTRAADSLTWPIPDALKEVIDSTFGAVHLNEGSLLLEWTPGYEPTAPSAVDDLLLSFSTGKLLCTNGIGINAHDGVNNPSLISAYTRGLKHLYMLRWSSKTNQLQMGIRGATGAWVMSTATAFDGLLNYVANMTLGCRYSSKFSNLNFYKRWLTDAELNNLK